MWRKSGWSLLPSRKERKLLPNLRNKCQGQKFLPTKEGTKIDPLMLEMSLDCSQEPCLLESLKKKL